MALTLKKFLKYFDTMAELLIYDWNLGEDNADKCLLFEGYVFDEGAEKKLKKLYNKKYVLERNDDGEAVMLFPYVNENGAKLCKVQINVCKFDKEKSKKP